MKNIKLIIALLSISFLFANFTNAQTATEEYCNARFNFCVEYPSSIFTEKYESANGDGIELINEAGDAYIVASGANNTLNTTVEAEYKSFLNYVIHSEGAIKEIDSYKGDNFLEITVQVRNKYFYYQTYISDKFIVAAMVRTDLDDPKASLAAFNYLKDAVSLEIDSLDPTTFGYSEE